MNTASPLQPPKTPQERQEGLAPDEVRKLKIERERVPYNILVERTEFLEDMVLFLSEMIEVMLTDVSGAIL